MSNLEDFNARLSILESMDSETVKQPTLPVDKFLQEGENLHHWCSEDKESLVAAGLNWSLVDDLTVNLGALREAQSRWVAERNTQEEAGRNWAEESPMAYDLRNSLLHTFRYAYRNTKDVLGRVSAIAEGDGHADMIQDLNDLAVLGKENAEPLALINFDTSLLENAASKANTLAELLAIVNGNRQEHSEIKTLRDKAFTLCKEGIDEIRACGKYVFWRNADRLKGYASAYTRKNNKKPRETEEDSSQDISIV